MITAELSEKSLQCKMCKKYKSLDQFYLNDKRCKLCQSLDKKKKYIKAKKTPKNRITRKRCRQCNEIKGSKRFPVYPHSKDGHADTCWNCKATLYNNLQNPNKFWWRKATIQNRYKLGKVTWIQLKSLYDQQDHRCFYCKVPIDSPELIHIDHAIPRSKGGNGKIKNLRVVCPDCNRLKHARTEEEFINFLMEYARRAMIIRTEEFV